MSHSRKLIRDQVVSILSGQTDAGTNVYANRQTSLWETELPAILVYTKQETAESRDNSGSQYIRTLHLLVEIKAEATSLVDDALDEIALDVEGLFAANRSLNGTALSSELKSTDITLDSGSEKQTGVAILTYEIKSIQ